MFLSPQLRAHPAFRLGAADMWPQAPGIAAWGLMTGVAMVKSGMSVFESLSMALLVFAGSSQLASIPLLVAGAPMWVILATGFCVNLRFVVFSLHLRPYLAHLPRWRRMAHGYFTADLTYVLFTRRYPHPADSDEGRLAQEAYIAGNSFVNWASWMLPSFIGVVLASSIPERWGLGFAGILCLVGILCSLASTRLRMVAAAVAAIVAVAGHAIPLKLNIVAAIGVAVLMCLWLERFRTAPKGDAA